LSRTARIAACLLVLSSTVLLRAQRPAQTPYKLDLAVSYLSEYSLAANTSKSFWLQGGSIELGTNTWKGLGAVANISGLHASSIGSSGIPLNLVMVTFGGRYRWHADHKVSVFVEGLGGEADGFKSLFPSLTGAQTSANGFAIQTGGAIDYALSPRFAIRPLEASWVRMTLPNATVSVQDDFRVGAGLVVKFGH
jgi:hypothetical protein